MGLIRFLVIIGLVYLLYRVLRTLMTTAIQSGRANGQGTVSPMVQDPSCKVYIPKKDAIKKVFNGETRYFCSNACLKKFEQEYKRGERP